ncbi:guanylate kinase-like isoform X2 [Limulus polyphemus]|uniref:Guanylate kinase-like isoform X2 n=1 Tax=Limulus polyphemus TaxID=6850 RepID=A0ABM1S8E5_LIMPO|nr:guanylate kinase-like isoform X2 [Limulus polyphemus]
MNYPGFLRYSLNVIGKTTWPLIRVNTTNSVNSIGVKSYIILGGVHWLSSFHPLVICGPSGCGKSTLLKILMKEYKNYFGFTVSHYHFVTRHEMQQAIEKGEFIEHVEYSKNLYGTSKNAIKAVQEKGLVCILDIEVEGVKNIKKTDLNPRYIFIKPPSMEALKERLQKRGTETDESINERICRAKKELEYGEMPGNFDIIVLNDCLEDAYRELKNYLWKCGVLGSNLQEQ